MAILKFSVPLVLCKCHLILIPWRLTEVQYYNQLEARDIPYRPKRKCSLYFPQLNTSLAQMIPATQSNKEKSSSDLAFSSLHGNSAQYEKKGKGISSKEPDSALAGVAQWIELQTANQRVAGLIPSQGTCLGCGPGPQEGAPKRQPHIDVSLPLFLPPL